MNPIRSHWTGRYAFILAATGSAVGLGNIWKFPYIAGVNGGGLFVIIYLVCIAVIGLPILIAELYIGQKAQANTVDSYATLHKKNSFWQLPGWLGLISAYLILSFYGVVGGWIFDYEFRAITGAFADLNEADLGALFGGLLSNAVRQIFWQAVFMVLVIAIVFSGIREGLERWNKILMPALFVLLALLLLQAMMLDGFSQAVQFLFSLNADQLTSHGILEAVGHSFFTLSLGMGAMLTYGSYLSKTESLPKVAVTVALCDTFVALAAGLVIFSVVFSFDMKPGAGPGLVLSTLPVLFAKMAGGQWVAIGFYLLVGLAALTSAISILEVPVAYVSENWKVSRGTATIGIGLSIFLLGLLTVFSFNHLSDVKIFSYTFFYFFDKLTSSWLLPIAGIFISLFYGWKLGTPVMPVLGKFVCLNKMILWSTRIVAPVAISALLVNSLVN
ncbi:sodium-dependent transporter [Pseudomonadota bacterium]